MPHSRGRRRDSNPRHADYDSAALWLCRAKNAAWGPRGALACAWSCGPIPCSRVPARRVGPARGLALSPHGCVRRCHGLRSRAGRDHPCRGREARHEVLYRERPRDPGRRSAQEWISRANRRRLDEVVVRRWRVLSARSASRMSAAESAAPAERRSARDAPIGTGLSRPAQARTGCPIPSMLPSLSRNHAPRSPLPLLG